MNKLSSADVTLDEVITTTGNAVRVSPLSYLETVPVLPDKTVVAQKKNRAHKPDVASGGSLGQPRGAGGVWGREPRAPGSRGPPAVGPVQRRSRRAGWSISSRGCVPVLIQHLSRP